MVRIRVTVTVRVRVRNRVTVRIGARGRAWHGQLHEPHHLQWVQGQLSSGLTMAYGSCSDLEQRLAKGGKIAIRVSLSTAVVSKIEVIQTAVGASVPPAGSDSIIMPSLSGQSEKAKSVSQRFVSPFVHVMFHTAVLR